MTDRDLLRQYTVDRSEAAFARLMEQHMKLVYWTSRRDVQDPQMAEDVAQVVFTLLARKAPTLGKDVSISGWLFNTARLASKNALRREANRRRGEQKAARMMEDAVHGEAQWRQIEPWLNDGLSTLAALDREAILLRYFEGLSFHELAGELGVSEEAARMRISRAVGKLRQYLTKREVVTTTAVLTALLAERASEAAPASCHAAVLHAVQAAGALSGAPAAAGHSQLGHLYAGIARHFSTAAPAKLIIAATAVTAVGLTAPFLLAHPKSVPAIPAAMASTAMPESAPAIAVSDANVNITASGTSGREMPVKPIARHITATPSRHTAPPAYTDNGPDPFRAPDSGTSLTRFTADTPSPKPTYIRPADITPVSAPAAEINPPIVAREAVKIPAKAAQVEPPPIILPQRHGASIVVPRRDWPPIMMSSGDAPPTIVIRDKQLGDHPNCAPRKDGSTAESKKTPPAAASELTSDVTTVIMPDRVIEVQ